MRRYPKPCYESGASGPVFGFIHRGYKYSEKQLYPAGIRVSTRRAQNDAP